MTAPPMIKKRCLLWDWTNTANIPHAIEAINFGSNSPISSCANWNAWCPPELRDRVPFRPTVRGLQQLEDPNEWNMISNNNHEIIHYFNEPERANISPDKAAVLWMSKIVPLRKEKGKKIVGPSCASDPAGSAWLDAFMSIICSGNQPPDYLGLHYYGTSATEAIAYLTKMHNTYPSLPIIVSEFASISRSTNSVENFTAQTANWMDTCPWIFEYAFFGCMAEVADAFVSPEAQLMGSDGCLTGLGGRVMGEQPMVVG